MSVVPVKFRVVAHKDTGLRKAPTILQRNLKGGLAAVGKRLQASARTRMRRDTGAEQKDLKIRVEGSGLNINLLVFSTLVQAFVDAYGMRHGVFPDFRVNSKLYNWAKRRIRGFPTKQVRTVGTPSGPRVIRRRLKKIRRLHRVVQNLANGPLPASKRARARNGDTKRLAFLVARSIFRRGRTGTKWHNKTMEANKSRIIREMSNALQRAANEIKRL